MTPSPKKFSPTDNAFTDFAFRFRVAIAMIGLTLFCSWCGFHYGDRYGLLIGFFLAIALNALVFFYVERRISKLFSARQLEGVDSWGVLSTVRSEARRLAVRVPQVLLLEIETPTAFSAGLSESGSKLFLTSGLLAKLTREEVALVIAYELERLKQDQTQSATAVTAVASLISTVANAFDAALCAPFRRGPRELRAYGPMTLITSPLVAAFNRVAVRRAKIFEIDERVAQIPTHKEMWAKTLWKLDSYNKTLPLDVNLAEASLFTVNPLSRHHWCRFTLAQPAIESRVRHLTGRFPL